jgi:hypothetical protein
LFESRGTLRRSVLFISSELKALILGVVGSGPDRFGWHTTMLAFFFSAGPRKWEWFWGSRYRVTRSYQLFRDFSLAGSRDLILHVVFHEGAGEFIVLMQGLSRSCTELVCLLFAAVTTPNEQLPPDSGSFRPINSRASKSMMQRITIIIVHKCLVVGRIDTNRSALTQRVPALESGPGAVDARRVELVRQYASCRI